MGVMADASGKPLSGRNASSNSGFIGDYGEGGSLTTGYSWPEEKYYDKYAYGTNSLEYTRGQFGDATFEIGPFKNLIYANNQSREISSWHADCADFVYHEAPWFYRGGSYLDGSDSGVFAFGYRYGSVYEHFGFRVVLSL